MNNTKKCSTCKITKDISCFTRRVSDISGVTGQCKDCRAKYRLKAKTKINETKRDYYSRYSYNYGVMESIKARSYIRNIVKRFSRSNLDYNQTFVKELGCTIMELATHLQQSADVNGYTLDIYDYDMSKYHIDHIIPFKSYISGSYTLEEITNYKNTQILTSVDNLLKGSNT